MWHSEMYGYVFAAAEVGVTHRIRRDVMLYPAYEPYLGRLPYIMHCTPAGPPTLCVPSRPRFLG